MSLLNPLDEGMSVAAEGLATGKPKPTLMSSVRDHFGTLIVTGVVFLVSGVAVGFLLPRSYGAQSRVIVGRGEAESGAVSVSGLAGESMAVTYSRVFDGDQVQSAIRSRLKGRKPLHITASTVPGSSVILIEAKDVTAADAVVSADAGAKALIDVVGSSTNVDQAAALWLKRYSEAARKQEKAQIALDAAQRAVSRAKSTTARATADATLIAVRADVSTAQVEVSTLAAQYGRVLAGASLSSAVQPLRKARLTSNSRIRNVELLGATGVMVGVGMGLLLAYLRATGSLARRQPEYVPERSTGAVGQVTEEPADERVGERSEDLERPVSGPTKGLVTEDSKWRA